MSDGSDNWAEWFRVRRDLVGADEAEQALIRHLSGVKSPTDPLTVDARAAAAAVRANVEQSDAMLPGTPVKAERHYTTDWDIAERFDWTGEAAEIGELLRRTFGREPGAAGTFTHTFTPTLPRTMTRRETYRHCIDNGWRRRDALLMALLSEDERPMHHGRLGPMFTIERSEGA